MSTNFEKEIKKSIEGFEYPYNPQAFERFQKGLNNSPSKFPYKWYIAAGTVLVAGISAFYFYSNQETVQDEKKTELSLTKSKNTAENMPTQLEQNQQRPSLSHDAQTNNDHESAPIESTHSEVLTQEYQQENILPIRQVQINQQEFERPTEQLNQTNKPSDVNRQKGYLSPGFENLCSGQTVKLMNENDFDLQILYPSGTVWKGKSHTGTSILLNLAGTYQVGTVNGQGLFTELERFQVKESPKASFSVIREDEKYDEQGLPVVYVQADGHGQNFQWYTKGNQQEGSKAGFHFYKKGEHDISLIATDPNGCQSKLTKSVHIDEDYNLLAVNSFDPYDLDPANNTFMPYSLRLRGDAFTMIIIDPRDGHVLYETNDPSLGWTGIDKQNGNMVNQQVAYIWKVTIVNPRKGEPAVYSGTITPIERRR